MRKISVATIFALFMPVAWTAGWTGASAQGGTTPQDGATPLPDLGWLSGCWQTGENSVTREVWSQDQGGILFGYSVTHRAGGSAAVAFEDLRIQRQGDGFVYIASPNGSAPTPFLLAAHGQGEATFENQDHDFPQRIRYARDGETLTASISTLDGEKVMHIPMISCAD